MKRLVAIGAWGCALLFLGACEPPPEGAGASPDLGALEDVRARPVDVPEKDRETALDASQPLEDASDEPPGDSTAVDDDSAQGLDASSDAGPRRDAAGDGARDVAGRPDAPAGDVGERFDATVDSPAVLDAAADGPEAGICGPLRAPASTQTVPTTGPFGLEGWPRLFVVGSSVLTVAPFDNWRTWYRLDGSTWVNEVIPWPAGLGAPDVERIIQLVDRTMLVVLRVGVQKQVLVYDGRAFAARFTLPDRWGEQVAAFTRTPDGVFHCLVFETTLTWSMYDGGPGGFGAPTRVPVSSLATVLDSNMAALTNGRIVIAYAAGTAAYVVTRGPGEPWRGPTRLPPVTSPTRVTAVATAARSGGVLVAANSGEALSVRAVQLFTSDDGVSFGPGEVLGRGENDAILSMDAECLANPLFALSGTTWRMATRGATGGIAVLELMPAGLASELRGVVGPSGRPAWAFQQTLAPEHYAVVLRGG